MDVGGLSVTLQNNACLRSRRVCRDNAVEASISAKRSPTAWSVLTQALVMRTIYIQVGPFAGWR
jgi:hypothetical protein